ncbi:MAG: carboxypeptidase regulatory-like domain-containing protein [Symploca sp. SIO1C2]|nr:carboxypeptidase regulatory-like domain-containing protein [Symploca sp. SIO1C2]
MLGLMTSVVIGITDGTWAQTNSNLLEPVNSENAATDDFTILPVGVNVGERAVIFTVLVRGQEDGSQAVDFAQWLVPYDTVIKALKLEVTSLADGQLEVRSPGLITRINPSQLRNDPELGLVFSIEEVQTLLGVPTEFDINEYAIVFNPPWLGKKGGRIGITAAPVQLEGLPLVKPAHLTLTAIEQGVNAAGSEAASLDYQGELIGVGTLLDGSWYFRVNQPELLDSRTWNLAEAQYLQQTDTADYVIGSQPSFWRTQTAGDYWGFTTIQRQGFTPPGSLGGGGFIPGQRLQASQVGRTIVGEAEAGTLVRLTQGFGDLVLAEVLVDSSGIYRFDDVPIGGRSFGNYRVLLYPQGRLTAQPEIRDATFSTVPGQIPAGASATIVSTGIRRQASGREDQSFVGEFTNVQGGVNQRWGISENITIGIGGVYDQVPRGIGEIFFRPAAIPLELAATVVSPDEEESWDVNASLRYNPTANFSAQFNSDRFSQRLNLNWRVSPNFSLLGIYNSRDSTAVGAQTAFSGRGFFTFARATIDTENRFRWNLTQRLGSLEFTQQGNEIGTLSNLDYNLSGRRFLNIGHSLLLNYETRSQNRSDNLLTLGWRYRSAARSVDGNHLWSMQLGYGVGSRGSGLVTTVQIGAIPGLLLRGRYEEVSVTTGQSSYSIELLASINLQQGIAPGDRQSDRFRNKGGVLIQPFFDRNNNGKRDNGEEIYTENPELLLILNNQPFKSFRPEIQANRILVRLPPAIYRLDLDPSGFPLDWQATVDAYAVEVVAGSYTLVPVPLIPSYTLSGVVTDAAGNPVAGARVEAVTSDAAQRRFSVTNGAGVYYLERLPQGSFTLQINGEPAQPGMIILDESSEPFQELNLQQPN